MQVNAIAQKINPRIQPSVTLLKSRNLSGTLRILEIGCKEGGIIYEVSNALGKNEVYGVDIDEEALKRAAERGINTNRVDLNTDRLPFTDGFFDIVLMEEVIEHLLNPDNSVQEVYRVLKPKGYFLVTTPNLAWWINRLTLLLGYQPYWTECSVKYNVGKFRRPVGELQIGHLRLFTLKALKQLFQLYGFQIICAKGITCGSLPSALNYLDRLLSRKSAQAEIIILLTQK